MHRRCLLPPPASRCLSRWGGAARGGQGQNRLCPSSKGLQAGPVQPDTQGTRRGGLCPLGALSSSTGRRGDVLRPSAARNGRDACREPEAFPPRRHRAGAEGLAPQESEASSSRGSGLPPSCDRLCAEATRAPEPAVPFHSTKLLTHVGTPFKASRPVQLVPRGQVGDRVPRIPTPRR